MTGGGGRRRRPPQWVHGCWAASVLAGAALLAGAGAPTRAAGPAAAPALAGGPAVPATVAGALARAAGADPGQVRVNGLYGSGHGGAWRFIAHLSWPGPGGSLRGGTVLLPDQGAAGPDTMDPATLDVEHRRGWTLGQLSAALAALPRPAAPLALVDLEITGGSADLVACQAGRPGPGSCQQRGRDGRVLRAFTDQLADRTDAGPLAVQRAGAPPA